MQKITFGACITGAWRDGWGLMRRRPLLIVVSIAITFFLRLAQDKLSAHPVPGSILLLAELCGLWLLRLLVINVVVVQAVRYVVLGNDGLAGRALIGRDYWRYIGVAYGLMVAVIAVMGISMILVTVISHLFGFYGHERALYATTLCAAGMFSFWVHLRFNLLTTHIAAGRPLNWRAAWHDTHGRFIAIVGTYLGLTLTLIPVAILGGAAIGLIAFFAHAGRHGPVLAIAQTMLLVPASIIAAAGAGWVYRRFAVSLVENGLATN